MIKREHFRIVRRLGFDSWDYILGDEAAPASLDLPGPGIYTLEGPNQSGKSLLIKLLSGSLPRSVRVSDRTTILKYDSSRLWVPPDGMERRVHIRTAKEAMRRGIFAVHQNDDLLPTLTVREHIFLRHLTPGLRSYAHLIAKFGLHTIFAEMFSKLGPFTSRLSRWFEELDPLEPGKLEERARSEISRFTSEDLMDKYPWELSGGAKAIVRLVCIRLYTNVRVLLLDEIFNAVDRDTWPAMMRLIRDWQEEAKCALLVVSHNTEELLRWQPTIRFQIDRRLIKQVGFRGYHSIHVGIPQRNASYAVFMPQKTDSGELRYTTPWFWREGDHGTFVVISSSMLISARPTSRVTSYLRGLGFNVQELVIDISEREKAVDHFAAIVDRVLDLVTQITEKGDPPLLGFCMVGGGALLNTIGFVTGTLYRGRIPTVWVPTTLTAMADVGVGSKTSLNVDGSRRLKNVIGTYSNPAAVIVDSEYIAQLPAGDRIDGLAECFKHGLLQDQRIYDRVCASLKDPSDAAALSGIAIDVMMMKSEVLSRFPFETGAGRILRFGHIHAHALERASDFTISHTSAVYWGLLLELKITEAGTLLDRVLEDLVPVLKRHAHDWVAADMTELRDAYLRDVVDSIRGYRPVVLSSIGGYGSPVSDSLSEAEPTSMTAVERAVLELRGVVQAKIVRP